MMIPFKTRRSHLSRQVLLRNFVITIICLMIATLLSTLFFLLSHNTANIAIIYVLAVVIIAQNTAGYGCGIVASLFSVAFINFVFTYPYMELNFILDGYPVTFLGMTIISSLSSTLTTHLKEEIQLSNEREHMLMEAEKEKMRANLLRAISHDLRTPLTSIIGTSTSYLEQGEHMDESQKTHLVKTIAEDAQWLLNMVENLLSVTRINNQTASVNTTLEPLEEVVSAALRRFYKRTPGAKVQARIPDELIMLPMDATLIEQVLINLLENAVYHSGSQTPTSLSVDTDNGFAHFHVRDYGSGISPDRLDTLFDGYPSTPNHSSDSHKGMGIGLSICKTIINAHHGQISAKNHPDGAEFIFSLPLGKIPMDHKITAVIIEDEKNILGFIETVLSDGSYKTFTAATGTDGLSLITSRCPDIILLDLGLPDMDGLEIIKKVRQFTQTPVIVISARTQEAEKVAALDLGADDYLTKPFGTSELMARIRTALRHSQNSKEAACVYSRGGLVIDFGKRRTTLDGQEVHLTQIEYKLVSLLARQAGKVLTYDYLMRQIWGPYNDSNNQILRVNMAHIRRKLEKNPAEPEYIFTEIGVGYRMRDE